jgi:hypothetical protein
MLPPPVSHSGSGPVLGPVPRHGEHTDAVLAEFAALAEPAVGGPPAGDGPPGAAHPPPGSA